MRSEPEIRQLRALVAIVEQGGFTRAAGALALSQSTVSEAIQALERTLGAPVFVKGKRRPTLTPVGEALLPHARRVLGAVDDAVGAVLSVSAAARATVTVGTSESISTYVLPPLLAELRREWPGTRYMVMTAACSAIRADLDLGRLDLGLVLEPAELGGDEESLLLAEGRLVVFARPDHRLAGRVVDSTHIAAAGLFLSDAAGSFHGLMQRYLQADGFGHERLHSTGSVEAVKRGVEGDADVMGLLPAHALQGELAAGSFVELPLRRTLAPVWLKALWRRSSVMGPQARALANRLGGVTISGAPPAAS